MLKKQHAIKKRIQKELSERCYQMGIPAVEEPKICFSIEQFKWYTGQKKRNKYVMGQCAFKHNTILVNLYNHQIWAKERRLNHVKFEEVRDTLIHELVHIRWQKQKHGYYFRELIKRVLNDEVFPMRTAEDKRFGF